MEFSDFDYIFYNISIEFTELSQSVSFNPGEYFEYIDIGYIWNDYEIRFNDNSGNLLLKVILGSRYDLKKLEEYLFGKCDYWSILLAIHNATVNNKSLNLNFLSGCIRIDDLEDRKIDDVLFKKIYASFSQNVSEGTSVIVNPNKDYKSTSTGFEIFQGETKVFTINYFDNSISGDQYKLNKNKLEKWLFNGENSEHPTPIYPITGEQLKNIFDIPLDRCDEVANLINKYSTEFGLDSKLKMSHFIGQIGAETKLTHLTENSYSSSNIKTSLKTRTCRTQNNQKILKYCDLFENHNSTTTTGNSFPFCDNSIIIPLDVVVNSKTTQDNQEVINGVTYATKDYMNNRSNLTAKSLYYTGSPNNMTFFNYVYAHQLGNGNIASGDGSRFRGRGFVQLTGYYNYNAFQTKWNNVYGTKKPMNFICRSAVCDENIKKIAEDLEIAILSALVYWDDNEVNEIVSDLSNGNIDEVTVAINGSLNGQAERRSYTKKANEQLP
mgnify:CR=1 FL=1